VPLTFFITTAHICTTMMSFDLDKFLPLFIKLSTSPYCTNISSQYNSTHYDNNVQQHSTRYNSTERTTLPLPGKSQCTHLSNVHNDRPKIVPALLNQCHMIVYILVCLSPTYVAIDRLTVLISCHTSIDSALELSRM
jgi:hypothetical protein